MLIPWRRRSAEPVFVLAGESKLNNQLLLNLQHLFSKSLQTLDKTSIYIENLLHYNM